MHVRPHMRHCCPPFGLAALGLIGSISVGPGRLAATTESDPKLASPV